MGTAQGGARGRKEGPRRGEGKKEDPGGCSGGGDGGALLPHVGGYRGPGSSGSAQAAESWRGQMGGGGGAAGPARPRLQAVGAAPATAPPTPLPPRPQPRSRRSLTGSPTPADKSNEKRHPPEADETAPPPSPAAAAAAPPRPAQSRRGFSRSSAQRPGEVSTAVVEAPPVCRARPALAPGAGALCRCRRRRPDNVRAGGERRSGSAPRRRPRHTPRAPPRRAQPPPLIGGPRRRRPPAGLRSRQSAGTARPPRPGRGAAPRAVPGAAGSGGRAAAAASPCRLPPGLLLLLSPAPRPSPPGAAGLSLFVLMAGALPAAPRRPLLGSCPPPGRGEGLAGAVLQAPTASQPLLPPCLPSLPLLSGRPPLRLRDCSSRGGSQRRRRSPGSGRSYPDAECGVGEQLAALLPRSASRCASSGAQLLPSKGPSPAGIAAGRAAALPLTCTPHSGHQAVPSWPSAALAGQAPGNAQPTLGCPWRPGTGQCPAAPRLPLEARHRAVPSHLSAALGGLVVPGAQPPAEALSLLGRAQANLPERFGSASTATRQAQTTPPPPAAEALTYLENASLASTEPPCFRRSCGPAAGRGAGSIAGAGGRPAVGAAAGSGALGSAASSRTQGACPGLFGPRLASGQGTARRHGTARHGGRQPSGFAEHPERAGAPDGRCPEKGREGDPGGRR
ncbi:collagen alpha-1(I) chain-like [Pogoniulus pusillus]|uniref:collagen alpha-1(I) chain-like n=1 Tax=Pogoniulus pusillus TaxID=488313 RepID=UPI0030B945E3